jgi:malonate-semialdehyde dehydrogenase (acetylating)/methylmalonate-semialdehyde dehydrogenase
MQRLPNVVPTHVRGLATAISRAPLSGLNAVARAKAEQISAEWKGTNASGENVKNYIGGKFVDSKSEQWIDLLDPVRPYRPSCRRRADGYSHSRRRP